MKINKESPLPAYAQLANMLRTAISRGEYPPGERLPAELTLAKSHGVSAMTARQAINMLEEEGLVDRKQGKGTYIRKIGVASSSFTLDSLTNLFADKDNLSVRIIKTAIKKTPGPEKEALGLLPNQPVVLVERVIFHRDQPVTLHVTYTEFDPKSPSVESMLDTVVLTELMFYEGHGNFKRGILHLIPAQLEKGEAALLHLPENESVFRLEHLYYDFNNAAAAYGWFLVSHKIMTLKSKIGIWNE